MFSLTRWTKLKRASGSVGDWLVAMLRTVRSPSSDCYPGADQIIRLISKSFYLHTLHLLSHGFVSIVPGFVQTPRLEWPLKTTVLQIFVYSLDNILEFFGPARLIPAL